MFVPQIIEAEGIAWPLETFLDSRGFIPRPDVFECRDRYQGPVEVVDDQGRVRQEIEARQVDWHSVLAVRAGSKVCDGCGLSFEPTADPVLATELVRDDAGRINRSRCRVFTVNSFEADFCEDCQDYGEWEY